MSPASDAGALLVNNSWRSRLYGKLSLELTAARNRDEQLALLVVNLVKFRQINADFGYAVGDKVLAEVYRRIANALRESDFLYHLGNDEYAVILTQLRVPQAPELAIKKILKQIGENMAIDRQVLSVSATAGAAVFPEHASDSDELLKAANAAMLYAREQQAGYIIYDATTRTEDIRQAELKGSLRTALDSGELMLHYQPQLNLQQGILCGCEALARWQHTEMGWISPELFIGVAERASMIDSLTYWSINVALREWFQFCTTSEAASVSVNLSAQLLHSPELVPMVEHAVNIWGAKPGSLVLEVTESAMMIDPRAALRTLHQLHEMGIKLSIDDFGTGYSSLTYLKKLPVSELKIDKSFILHMAEQQQDRRIVQSVIDLAHTLDMVVVAEGIENEQILNMLVAMGCDYGQGFFIARPMPAAELHVWARSSVWDMPEEVLSKLSCEA